MDYTFKVDQKCPACGASFRQAMLKKEHDPVVIVVCPRCATLLWRPGSEEDVDLVVFKAQASDVI